MFASSTSADLQQAVLDLLVIPGALRVSVPGLAQRPKSLSDEIEQAVANYGLCITILPPLPTRAMQGVPFVFFETCELRVRIIEKPALNQSGADAYELSEDIAVALHWQPKAAGTALDGILAHPLQLALRPVELVDEKDTSTRTLDVIFEATLQINTINE